MTATLRVEALEVRSADAALVQGVSFALEPGRPFTVLGETGSGKSLVAQAVMGTLAPELAAAGRIMLGDRDLLASPPAARRALWGRQISLLPQEPWLALDPTMRLAGQVTEVHRLVRGLGGRAAKAAACANLATVGLADAAARYPFQMSGGMCQRASIAIADAAGCPILLADEPTKGLDSQLRDGVVARLRAEAAAGRCLFTITHDVAVARGLGGLLAVMLDGRLVDCGPAEQVLTAPGHPYSRALIAADPQSWPRRLPAPSGPAILSARGLSKAYGRRTLFADLDLDVHAGEIVAVVGPSGCGKTTLGDVLLGLRRPDGGTVHRPGEAAPIRFQKLYQDPPAAFAGHQTLAQALADLARRHGLAWRRVETVMARLRLGAALLDRRPGQISGGELQRFALARVLLLDPVLLFADEATSRLDPVSQKEVIDLLLELVAERQLALLLVTHDQVLAERIADRTIRFETAAAEYRPPAVLGRAAPQLPGE